MTLRKHDFNQEQTKSEVLALPPFYTILDKTKSDAAGNYTAGATSVLGGKGGTLVNKTVINVSVNGKDRDIDGITRTVVHEAGHSGGLEHPWELNEGGSQLDIQHLL